MSNSPVKVSSSGTSEATCGMALASFSASPPSQKMKAIMPRKMSTQRLIIWAA
jgi:hypothetical protein